MLALPHDIIILIFDAISDQCVGRSPSEWIQHLHSNEGRAHKLHRECNLFFPHAALVCKTWYRLVQHCDRSIWLDDERTAELLLRSLRNGALYRITRLHIAERLADMSPDSDDFVTSPLIVDLMADRGELFPHVNCISVPKVMFYADDAFSSMMELIDRRIKAVRFYSDDDAFDWRWTRWAKSARKKLQLLALDCLYLENASTLFRDAAPPLCKELHPSWVEFELEEEFAALFPDTEILHAEYSLVRSKLSFVKPTPSLHDLTIRQGCIQEIQRNTVNCLISPSLRRLHITLESSRGFHVDKHDLAACTFPAHKMPNLVSLQIDPILCAGCKPWAYQVCAAFADPTFCPKMTRLPRILAAEASAAPQHADDVTEERLKMIRQGLDGLHARGVVFSDEEIAGTLWQYAARLPIEDGEEQLSV